MAQHLTVWQRVRRFFTSRKQSGIYQPVPSRGWFPIVRESFPGAWQRNIVHSHADVLTYAAVYACITLIASDIGKLRPKLVQQDANGVWKETENPAWSPVLRKPNRYQTRIEFFEHWQASKHTHGNAYVLKQRNNAQKVEAMYVLDPQRVRVLVAPDGGVFYALSADNLTGLDQAVTVPASEIIHDKCVTLYHPLVGVSPLTACGLAATQGIRIQAQAERFFGNGSVPSGVLSTPEDITEEQAGDIQSNWERQFSGENVGRVAVVGFGMKYEPMTMTALDAQLIEQLKWTGENVCTAFHVPAYMVGIGAMPNYNNIEALNLQYYSQCLQNPIEKLELLLDEGLGLAPERIGGIRYGVELELRDLARMDTASQVKAATDMVSGSVGTPNEARATLNLPPITGGDTVYLQQQNFSLAALAERDSNDPFSKPEPAPAAPSPTDEPEPDDDDEPAEDVERAVTDFLRRELSDLVAA
jgi:HK97 family phage portal protein